MSGGQLGLVPKGTINSADIKNPSILQAQVHRDEAASGSGSYYGKQSDGVEELIGGPGAAALQMTAEVDFNIETLALSSTVYGGIAPFTYDWQIKSDSEINDNISYNGATNAATAALNPAGANDAVGMVGLKVTDSQGRVAFGYFDVELEANVG